MLSLRRDASNLDGNEDPPRLERPHHLPYAPTEPPVRRTPASRHPAQNLMEYALLMLLICMVGIAAISLWGQTAVTLFNTVNSALVSTFHL